MIVLVLLVVMFIVMVFLPVDHFFDQAGLHQEREGSVNGRLGDPAPFLSEAVGKLFGLEVAFHGGCLLQDLLPFRCPFQSLLLQVIQKSRFHAKNLFLENAEAIENHLQYNRSSIFCQDTNVKNHLAGRARSKACFRQPSGAARQDSEGVCIGFETL